MRFGLDVAQQRMTWPENVARVKFAEELGFDGVWGFDHFQPMYGDGPGRVLRGADDARGVERRHRARAARACSSTGMTYRHPSVFAAEAITIDHASNGRLELVVRRGVVRQGAHTSSASRSRR